MENVRHKAKNSVHQNYLLSFKLCGLTLSAPAKLRNFAASLLSRVYHPFMLICYFGCLGANPSARKIKPVEACLQEADFNLTEKSRRLAQPKYIPLRLGALAGDKSVKSVANNMK